MVIQQTTICVQGYADLKPVAMVYAKVAKGVTMGILRVKMVALAPVKKKGVVTE